MLNTKPHLIPPGILWQKLSSIPNFFRNLPWTHDGHTLWDAMLPLKPTILTSVTGNWSVIQKIDWITRDLGPDVSFITCLSKHKHYYCPTDRPGAILIDNKESLRSNWQERGGVFILHKNAFDTINQLESLIGIQLDTSSRIHHC